jgi:hypothetical protein
MLKSYKDEILSIYKNNLKGSGWNRILRAKKYEYLLNALNEDYNFLPSLKEQIYWLYNDLKEYPKCCVCGAEIKNFKSICEGYFNHCSCRCTQLDTIVRNKNKQTNLERYGVDNGAKSESAKQKYSMHCEQKYGKGITNSFMADTVKDKIKKTNLERYNVDNPGKNKFIKSKARQTLQTKYGVNVGFAVSNKYYFHTSKGELELYNYIKSITNLDVHHTDRKTIFPRELDIYIPDLKLAFEYDGDYWHSLPNIIENDKLKDNLCNQHNIKLVRIKESDWQSHKELIKIRIKDLIGKDNCLC